MQGFTPSKQLLIATIHCFLTLSKILRAKLFKIFHRSANATDCINTWPSTTGLILAITLEESQTKTFEFSLIHEKESRLSDGQYHQRY